MASINYPITGNQSRYAYLYRLQELLKLEHNEKGRQYREGLITEQEWIDYKSNDFDPKSQLISEEICKYRELLKVNSLNKAKLTDIVNEESKEM